MKRWFIALPCLVIGALLGVFLLGPLALQGKDSAAPAIPKEMTSYRHIVKKVLPAVVSIEGRVKPVKVKMTDKKKGPAEDPRVPEEYRKFFEEFGMQPPTEGRGTPHTGMGSGFLVDSQGVVLTNFHVVDGVDEVLVELQDGRKFVSKDIKGDPKSDLAIVRIHDKQPFPYLEMGDSNDMEIGDRVLAVGAPFGLTGSVTAGIISAKGRDIHMNMYEDFLQTDAAINPGNSGGPLVNLEGKVIGIDSAIKSQNGGSSGVGLAISSNLAKNIMTQLLTKGSVQRGYLGVQIKNLDDPDLAARLGVTGKGGILVSRVFENGPAAKAGIKDGDIITSLAGKSIQDGRELQKVVANLPLSKPADITVVRDGKSKNLKVTVEEQPAKYGTERVPLQGVPKDAQTIPLDQIGAEAVDMTPDMAETLGFKQTSGALVMKVDPDGLAADSGLGRGMLVVKVDDHPVKSAADFKDLLAKASLKKGALVQVLSPQGTSFVLLKEKADK